MRNGWKLPGFESPDPKPSARPEPKVEKGLNPLPKSAGRKIFKYINIQPMTMATQWKDICRNIKTSSLSFFVGESSQLLAAQVFPGNGTVKGLRGLG